MCERVYTYLNIFKCADIHTCTRSSYVFVLLAKWREEEGEWGTMGGAGGRGRGRARAIIKTRTKLDHAVEADILSTGCTGHLLVVLGLGCRASRLGLRVQDWV